MGVADHDGSRRRMLGKPGGLPPDAGVDRIGHMADRINVDRLIAQRNEQTHKQAQRASTAQPSCRSTNARPPARAESKWASCNTRNAPARETFAKTAGTTVRKSPRETARRALGRQRLPFHQADDEAAERDHEQRRRAGRSRCRRRSANAEAANFSRGRRRLNFFPKRRPGCPDDKRATEANPDKRRNAIRPSETGRARIRRARSR